LGVQIREPDRTEIPGNVLAQLALAPVPSRDGTACASKRPYNGYPL